MPDKSEKKSGTTNQYPDFFRGNRVRIVTAVPERFSGYLLEIQEYRGKILLILKTSDENPVVVNFDHIVYMEEV